MRDIKENQCMEDEATDSNHSASYLLLPRRTPLRVSAQLTGNVRVKMYYTGHQSILNVIRTLTVVLDLSIPRERVRVMTQQKINVQRSVGRFHGDKRTDGQTNATDCFTFAERSVITQAGY